MSRSIVEWELRVVRVREPLTFFILDINAGATQPARHRCSSYTESEDD